MYRGETNRFLQTQGAYSTRALKNRFSSLNEVGAALKDAGLESAQLIFGVDFTKSNIGKGLRTFGGKCLHTIDDECENPYQQVIRMLGNTLEEFDTDGVIPAYGFGDSKTKDKDIFPLVNKDKGKGFKSILSAYSEIAPTLRLDGPRSFAPLIQRAIGITVERKAYHILVIVADGLEENTEDTINAIVEASQYPISIILVGVGDGLWDDMEGFEERLPKRLFDNFHFVNYNEVIDKGGNKKEEMFVVEMLQEIPDHYIAIKEAKHKLRVAI